MIYTALSNTHRGTAAVAAPPFRPGNPALAVGAVPILL